MSLAFFENIACFRKCKNKRWLFLANNFVLSTEILYYLLELNSGKKYFELKSYLIMQITAYALIAQIHYFL